MKRTLQMIAAIFVTGAVIFWAVAGANRGWTKTHIPIKTVDTVTGLDGVEWRATFVPGIDFLGLALLGAAFLAGLSLFVPSKSNQPTIEIENENDTYHPGFRRYDGHRLRRAADV